jgi:hypothetical protein
MEEDEDILAEFDNCPKCGDTGYWFNGEHFEKCNCK